MSYIPESSNQKILKKFFSFLSDFKSEDAAFDSVIKYKIQNHINRIMVIVQQYHNNINDLFTAYVDYNMDTESYEKFGRMNSAEVVINSIISQFDVVTNSIKADINDVKLKYSETYSKATNSIENVAYTANSIEKNMESIDTTNIMIDNSVDTYKSQYISNWLMIIGIILISSYLTNTFFKSNLVKNIP